MKRVMVIGCCGAGKSTFSRKLAEITKLEKVEWKTIVTKLSNRPNWIIDGNYGGTMDIRMEKADTIIYLDYPTIKCLWRITKRILKYKGQVRPDMPEGCKERFDLDFYHYVATYNLISFYKICQRTKKDNSCLITFVLLQCNANQNYSYAPLFTTDFSISLPILRLCKSYEHNIYST